MRKITGGLFMGLLFVGLNLFGQDRNADLSLIAAMNYDAERILYYAHSEKNNLAPVQFHSNSFLVKINPVNLFFKGLMTVYQKAVSPQISASCMYQTTCSNFSKEAIHEFGLFKGIFLSADRLLRCNKVSAKEIPPMDMDIISGKAIDPLSKYSIKVE
jgi:putative membrane protein insertion efficiency factor